MNTVRTQAPAVSESATEREPDGVDVGQIREMLRLTPTQRLRKAWRYGELVLEMQRAAGLRQDDA